MDKPDINRDILKKISNHLILNDGFTNNVELYHEKMGVAIFFCHYARYKTNLREKKDQVELPVNECTQYMLKTLQTDKAIWQKECRQNDKTRYLLM